MGGSKSQTVGYKYFKGVMAVIGNRIEQLLDINPDNRGWIMTPEQKKLLKSGRISLTIDQPNLFGGDKKEGGWVGALDIYVGEDNQPQNPYLAQQIGVDVSAYPNLSYMVFRGFNADSLEPSLDKGFQLVSMSGMMKEFMIWVKRTRIKNDGSRQWYEKNIKGDIVCEIGSTIKSDPKGLAKFNAGTTKITHSRSWSSNTAVVENKQNNQAISSWSFILNTSGDWSTAERKGSDELFFEDLKNVVIKITVRYVQKLEVDGPVAKRVVIFDDGVLKVEEIYTPLLSGSSKLVLNFSHISSSPVGGVYYEYMLIQAIPSVVDESIENIDINPIHKIREILTDYTAMGKPEFEINDENFRKMADRIYDEGLGISWCIQQKSCKEAIEELEYHIEGGVRINRQTGLYEVILFRDDLLNLDNTLHFDESNIKTFQPDIINTEDQINAVNVSFYDRDNIKDSSFSLSDVGSFHTIDHENAEDLKFPYFMNRRNAEKVANWKLKQLSTMAWKGTFTTGKYEARRLNKYDVVLLSWKSKNIVNLPVRVMNINLGNGRDNTVTLDFVEVVPHSNISYSSINVDPNPNPILPPQSNSSIVFEMPYFEAVQRMGQTSVDSELSNNPEIGYLMAATIKPQNNSLSALLYSDSGLAASNFEEVGVVDYCAGCSLDQDISYTDTSFAVKKAQDLSLAKLGTLIQLDQELLVYQSYDPETKVLTVKRGALDTIPKPHLKDAVFYFWDDSSGLDQTVYVDGETVHAKVLTTTPSGVENLDTSAVRTLEIKGRLNRPYPPANVKINGEYWPAEIETDLILTWVDRNRLQQTGGAPLGFFDDGIAIEASTQTHLIISQLDENQIELATLNVNVTGATSYTVPISSMQANTRFVKVTLKTMRDGYECLQPFDYTVELSQFFSAPYDLTVEFKND